MTRGCLLILVLLTTAFFLEAQVLPLSRSAGEILASGDAGTVTHYHASTGVLELRTVFRQDGSRRACWDLPLSADLRVVSGLKMRIRCVNADLSSQLEVFLRVDGVWHRTELNPRTNGKWEELFLSKASFLPEGSSCVSWRRCDRLRISAWRGGAGTLSLCLSSLEFLPANVPLALVRGSGRKNLPDTTRKEALRYVRIFGDAMARGGFHPAVVDEADLTPTLLKNYTCVILPEGESLGDDGVDLLCGYLHQGGRIAAFYCLPPRLANAMHLPGATFRKVSGMASALAGVHTNGGAEFRQNSHAILEIPAALSGELKVRAWWMDANGRRTALPAIVQCPYGFWMTHVYLNQDPQHAVPVLAAFLEDWAHGVRSAAARQLLQDASFALDNAGAGEHRSARQAMERARQCQQKDDYPGTFAAVSAVYAALVNEALPGGNAAGVREMRGGWIRSSTGFPEENWWKTLRRFKLARLNAVFPLWMTPYATAWDSKVLTGRRNSTDEEVVAQCLAAATGLGIQVHAWCQLLNVSDAPESLRAELAAQDRLQKKANGTTIPWLCPTRRENLLLLSRLVGELSRNYALAGIHLDMARYEGSGSCFCEHCREAFGKFAGHALQNWPQCVQAGGTDAKKWDEFRQHQITQLVKQLAEAARAARPKIQVSAAVYPNLDDARRNVGQNWLEWLRQDIVDFVCPMDYRPTAALFQGDLGRMRTEAGRFASRLCPGIGVTVHSLSAQEVSQQMRAVRSAGMAGFLLFEATPAALEQLSP